MFREKYLSSRLATRVPHRKVHFQEFQGMTHNNLGAQSPTYGRSGGELYLEVTQRWLHEVECEIGDQVRDRGGRRDRVAKYRSSPPLNAAYACGAGCPSRRSRRAAWMVRISVSSSLLAVTMSQKSSVLQSPRSVPLALMPDTPHLPQTHGVIAHRAGWCG
jgi:hypothetical protein